MLDLVIVPDLTGSMASVSRILSKNCQELAQRLNESLPGSRMTVVGIGNYAAGTLSKSFGDFKDLSSNVKEITDFLNDNHGVRGGYSPGYTRSSCSAAYELGLKECNNLTWRSDVAKVVLVIGDEECTSKSHGQQVDYKQELVGLKEKDVQVYGVQCLMNRHVTYFYKEISQVTGGYHLQLNQFADILELVVAVAYSRKDDDSLESFAEELKRKARMSRSMLSIFNTLSGKDMSERLQLSFSDVSQMAGDLVPVDPSRFQVMNVGAPQDIKSFAIDNGCLFRVGKGFYELTKAEEIQPQKEIVLQDKATGDMWSGSKARDMINLPLGQRGKVSPSSLGFQFMDKYNVFVQSTSVNRKLMCNTKFLYEAERKLATV